MSFKIVRLTAIHNRSKWTISAMGGFELLQMVSKPSFEDAEPQRGGVDTRQCARWASKGGGL